MRDIAPAQSGEKKPLSPWFRKFLQACIPICIVMFVVGGLGLTVLIDKHYGNYKWALTTSAFGKFWIRATESFPFINALAFNGGMLGALLVGHNIAQDNKVRKTVNAAAAEKQKGGRQRKRQRARSKKAD